MRNTYGRSGPQPPAAPAPVPAPKVVVQAELTHDSSARPRRRRDRMPGWLFWPLIALLAAVMCFSGWKLFSVYADYRRGTKDYQSLAEYAPLETFAPQETAPADSYLPKDDYALDDLKDDPARPSVVQRLSLAPMDFDALTAEYPHIVAWIVIPGTNINYPVVYSGITTTICTAPPPAPPAPPAPSLWTWTTRPSLPMTTPCSTATT